MKKILSLIISICILMSLVSAPAFASETSLNDLLEKLQTLVTEAANDDVPEDTAPMNGGLSPKSLYDMTAPRVVDITVFDENGYAIASGSGFFINDHGDIVTNYHVIEDACSAEVSLLNGDTYEVQYVLAFDSIIDLAVLRIDLQGNDYIPAAKEPAATGDTIYTLGSTVGLTGTFSDGLVATASRIIDGVDYIQITAPISSGNSGGPLINSQGEVLGVNTWSYNSGQNVNFAVNIQELTKLDFSSPVTMKTLYARELENKEASMLEFGTDNPDILEWLKDSDLTEAESNDEMENADILPNDYWLAGSIQGVDDCDSFSVVLTDPATVGIIIMPYYEEDNDYILAGLTDEEGNIIAYAEPDKYEGSVFQYLEAELEEGIYYLFMFVADEYPYEEPAFYQISAYW